MKTTNWILFLLGTGFLVSLPVLWFVTSLASNLSALHPAAGWMIWAVAAIAAVCVLVPVFQLLRLPSLPSREMWLAEQSEGAELPWAETARHLVATCDDRAASSELRRYLKDLPNDLPGAVRSELRRRKQVAAAHRSATVRQAALLSFLSPNRQLDGLILFWLNLRQVHRLSRSYGFRPSPRGILRLYGSVAGAAIALESLDEVAEQLFAEGAHRLAGGVPIAGQAAAMLYDPLRAAAYVGFIGLLTEHLLRHELQTPSKAERRDIRRTAWTAATEQIGELRAYLLPSPVATPESEL